MVDGFAASATIVFEIDDQNKSCREDQKVEESGRMEERVAALENVVNFLMSQIGENQKRPIKSELKQLKRSPEVVATYDDWPVTPYLF